MVGCNSCDYFFGGNRTGGAELQVSAELAGNESKS